MANSAASKKAVVAKATPYQLDVEQVNKAANALVSHMNKQAQKQATEKGKKSMFADEDEETESEKTDEVIYLTVATKEHVKDQTRLRPYKLPLLHPIEKPGVNICLITADPQRAYKDLIDHPSFPEDLKNRILRVISLSKLKAKYNRYENKRQLAAEYDVFLADERIIKMLPDALGKVFYQGGQSKRPIPVDLTAGADKSKATPRKAGDKSKEGQLVGTPQGVAREIEGALKATLLTLGASANTSIKIGTASMAPRKVAENVGGIVSQLTQRYIPKGWKNIRALHIKGPTTIAVPIWLADELWADEEKVLDGDQTVSVSKGKANVGKKRKYDEWEEELMDEDELAEKRAKRSQKSKKNKAGSDEQSKSVSTISKEKRKKLKDAAIKSVDSVLT